MFTRRLKCQKNITLEHTKYAAMRNTSENSIQKFECFILVLTTNTEDEGTNISLSKE